MSSPRIVLCSLVLNETEWLQHLYAQHKDWPGLVKWIFVEAADRAYADVNPSMVTLDYLSVDGTTEYLNKLSREDDRITHIPSGPTWSKEADQGKCPARAQYCTVIDVCGLDPDLMVVLDADEFYTREHQGRITEYGKADPSNRGGYCFKQRHIWYPTGWYPETFSYQLPEHWQEVRGGYWDVPHCRVWRWRKGLTYAKNHNWPQTREGVVLNSCMARYDRFQPQGQLPQCVHLGYASQKGTREAKHRYYVQRGEGQEPDPRVSRPRKMYLRCRAAWEKWKPGDTLPDDARVVAYQGPIPEIFQERAACQM